MNPAKHILTLGAVLVASICSAAAVTDKLRCEYLTDPMGIDAGSPRLSWTQSSSQRGEKQTAYQILVASSLKTLGQDKGDLWDTGKVASDEDSQIVYSGSPLTSRQSCYWKVRTWDRDGKPAHWSPVAQWHMGLLTPVDWKAQWIVAEVSDAPATASLVIRHASYEAVEKSGAADVRRPWPVTSREIVSNWRSTTRPWGSIRPATW
jgi:hypothetical protein